MRIQLMSDIHFEHHADAGDSFIGSIHPNNVDVLVLAGDVCEMLREDLARATMTALCRKFEHVLWVPGNHEYYSDRSVATTEQRMRDLESTVPSLKLLRTGEVVTIKGQRFLGDTMWFSEDPLVAATKYKIKDARCISNLYPWVHQHNAAFRKFLKKELKEGDIVVTHHLPSRLSIAPRWKTAITNSFFVSEQDDLIMKHSPAFWFHGHTHDPQNYMLGKTQVIANPLGYPYEAVPFNENLVVETLL